MSGSLTVRIDNALEGDAIEAGVPFTVRAILDQPDRPTKRLTWTGAAAIGNVRRTPAPYWSVLELPAGRYEIEAVLPSGEFLEGEAQILEGKSHELVLRGETPPGESHSWSEFGRSRAASAVEKAVIANKTATSFAVPPPDVSIGLGSTLTGDPHSTAASWWDWYAWLEQRAARAAEGVDPPPLRLGGGRLGLEFAVTVGDDGGSPMIVSVRDDHRYDHARTEDFGKHRLFLGVSSRSGERISAVPWPWPVGPDARSDGGPFFELHVAERNGQLVTDPNLRDPTFGGVIAYLNAGRVGRAGLLLNAAREALFEKWTHPLAAAAGGYVLMSTAETDELHDWPDWLANLADNFEGIPDGAILRAKWLLEQGEPRALNEAHQLLYHACDRGLPFFAAGVTWLINGLRRVAVKCPECRERLRMVQGVARSMDLSQAFTCIDLPSSKERSDGFQHRIRLRPPARNQLVVKPALPSLPEQEVEAAPALIEKSMLEGA